MRPAVRKVTKITSGTLAKTGLPPTKTVRLVILSEVAVREADGNTAEEPALSEAEGTPTRSIALPPRQGVLPVLALANSLHSPIVRPPTRDYFFTSALTLVGDDTARLSFTACGSLSALASKRLTCHISVVESEFEKPGIPVIRIPPATFQ